MAKTVYGEQTFKNALVIGETLPMGSGTPLHFGGKDAGAPALIPVSRRVGMNIKTVLTLRNGTDALDMPLWAGGLYAPEISAPGDGVGSEQFGSGAYVVDDYSVAIGYLAEAGGLESVVVGARATAEADGTIAIGGRTYAELENSIAIGTAAQSSGTEAIAIGSSSLVLHAGAVVIGHNALSTSANRVTLGKVGGSASEIKQLQVSAGFAAFGGAPPASQPAHVPDPSGQTTDLDVEARSAINSILAALEGAGIIASS